MEVCGIPSQEVLKVSQRKKKFFTDENNLILVPNSRGKIKKPGTKTLEDILESDDHSFVNFIEVQNLLLLTNLLQRCLDWNPETRMTPD